MTEFTRKEKWHECKDATEIVDVVRGSGFVGDLVACRLRYIAHRSEQRTVARGVQRVRLLMEGSPDAARQAHQSWGVNGKLTPQLHLTHKRFDRSLQTT